VYDPDPAAVLRNLNTVLYQEYRRDARYCTVVFGILTPEARRLHGHRQRRAPRAAAAR
jgi:serine phosphatase RsbU (regulator of sigma subunit)